MAAHPHAGLGEAQIRAHAASLPCRSDGNTPTQLHPLKARCFACVGDAGDPRTWHLPYLDIDGNVDGRRLPEAIGSILSNYRGAHVTSIPESAIPDVLERLAHAAHTVGEMPSQTASPASSYVQLAAASDQIRPGSGA